MLLATKTLDAINACLEADQGAKFRGLLKDLMPLAGDAYRTDEDGLRSHLGASLIGRECARELWYSFRWATKKHFEGRVLRLFNRGHLEEPRFVALLMMIGCEVWQVDSDGNQFRISDHEGHFGSAIDGVVKGIPDLPDHPILTEYKTHGDSSFQKLKKEGVIKTKFEHFVQMQIYMGKLNLVWALYAAVNKNDDDLHMELVQFDPSVYARYLSRAQTIIFGSTPPPKLSESPGWFQCKYCDQKPVCHGGAQPQRNCRTCEHSRTVENKGWVCHLANDPRTISKEAQLKGCEHYEPNPTFRGEKS